MILRVLQLEADCPAGIDQVDLEIRLETGVARHVVEAAIADATRRLLASFDPPHFDKLPVTGPVPRQQQGASSG